MTNSINTYTRKQLLSLPVRNWAKESAYDSLIIISSGKKHDSGWAMMAIIGCLNFKPVEIASICSDDIGWETPKTDGHEIRSDMIFPCGAIHFWSSRKGCFKVGAALSSINIKYEPKQ